MKFPHPWHSNGQLLGKQPPQLRVWSNLEARLKENESQATEAVLSTIFSGGSPSPVGCWALPGLAINRVKRWNCLLAWQDANKYIACRVHVWHMHVYLLIYCAMHLCFEFWWWWLWHSCYLPFVVVHNPMPEQSQGWRSVWRARRFTMVKTP